MRYPLLLSIAIVASILAGCQTDMGPSNQGDNLRLLAGEEANDIKSPKDRLTRQLNIAEAENNHSSAVDARKTLAAAAETLRSANDLDDRTRLAGWVSISELSRGANDTEGGAIACNEAVAALRKIDPPAARCEYIIGVASEVRRQQGKPQAVKLLTESAAWAEQIKDIKPRREAFLFIALEVVSCNDTTAARDVLRHDPDAAWRSDTLLQLAANYDRTQAMAAANAGSATEFETSIDPADPHILLQQTPLDYRSNFKYGAQTK